MKYSSLFIVAAAFCLALLSGCGGGGGGSSTSTDQDVFNAGYTSYNAKSYAKAAATFESLIVTYPNSSLISSAYYYLGKSLYHLNDFSGAITKFDVVLGSYPSSAFADNALLWKGKSLQQQANIQFSAGSFATASALFVNARAAYQLVIDSYPGTTLIPDCRYQIGLTYYDEKGYATAIPLLQAVLSGYPASGVADGAQYYLARAYHGLALTSLDFARARTEYVNLITNYPASVFIDNAQYQIGKTYYDELNYINAITEFNKLLTNYAGSTSAASAQYYKARSINELALVATVPYTLAQARTEYLLLISAYPASIWVDNAQYRIGKSYYDEANYAGAIVELNKLLTIYPASSYANEAQYYIGRSYHKQSNYVAARATYGLAIAYNPASILADNASYYSAYTYHDSTQCTSELTAMQAFVAAYPSSTFVASANAHINDLPPGPRVTHATCTL